MASPGAIPCLHQHSEPLIRQQLIVFQVVLEAEMTNMSAIRLYEKLGFARDKMLFRYYLNGVDAVRLKLWLK